MTANDSDVSDGDTLTGSQVVRVYGENLTAPFVTLTFGGVECTPLYQGEDYAEFFLGDNGTAVIAVDGNQFMSFEIEDVTIPSALSGRVFGGQVEGSDIINTETIYDGNLMYPYLAPLPDGRFRVILWGSSATPEQSDVTPLNATIQHASTSITNALALNVTPTDYTKPVYLVFEGYVFFVGNYTTE